MLSRWCGARFGAPPVSWLGWCVKVLRREEFGECAGSRIRSPQRISVREAPSRILFENPRTSATMGPALPTHPSSIAGAAERRDRDRLRDPRGPFTSFPACPAHQHDEAKDHQAEREQDEHGRDDREDHQHLSLIHI